MAPGSHNLPATPTRLPGESEAAQNTSGNPVRDQNGGAVFRGSDEGVEKKPCRTFAWTPKPYTQALSPEILAYGVLSGFKA